MSLRANNVNMKGMVPFDQALCGSEMFTINKQHGADGIIRVSGDTRKNINLKTSGYYNFRGLSYDPSIDMLLTVDLEKSKMGIYDSVGNLSTFDYISPEQVKFKEAGADAYFDENRCMTVVLNGMYTDEGKLIIQKTYLDWTQGAPFKQDTISIEDIPGFICNDFTLIENDTLTLIGYKNDDLYIYIVEALKGSIIKSFRIEMEGKASSITDMIIDNEPMYVISQDEGNVYYLKRSNIDVDNATVVLSNSIKVSGTNNGLANCRKKQIEASNKCLNKDKGIYKKEEIGINATHKIQENDYVDTTIAVDDIGGMGVPNYQNIGGITVSYDNKRLVSESHLNTSKILGVPPPKPVGNSIRQHR